MLDLTRLKRTTLKRRPPLHYLLSYGLVAPTFAFPRRTRVVIEGLENLPQRRVFLAMNHTDRFNSFPFQYTLLRRGYPCTAAWVKGKYYEHRLMAWLMEGTNNIPLPSRGYLLVTLFRRRLKRLPSDSEYRTLRGLIDGTREREAAAGDEAADAASQEALRFFLQDCNGAADFVRSFNQRFDEMMGEVVRLTRQALFEQDLNLVVFPEGTRSARLGQGQTGLAQVSQHLSVPVVPVGCNGSNRVFPGKYPLSRGGTITYRVGKPLDVDDPALRPFRVPTTVMPLTRAASADYGENYRRITDVIMQRLATLLDPDYLPDPTRKARAAQGTARFV